MPGGLHPILNFRSYRRILPIASIAGATTGTVIWNARRAFSVSVRTSMAPRTWISTGNGTTMRLMAPCGLQTSRPVGLLINRDAGFGKTIMGGPGSVPIPGVGRRITMAAGFMVRSAGLGTPDQLVHAVTGRRPTSGSLALVVEA